MKTILKSSKWFIPLTMSFGMMMMSMGCEEEISQSCEGDQAQHIEQFFEGDFNAAICRLQNLEINSGENNLVIKNQSDYEKYVTCNNDLPDIDFDKYFILAGVYQHHQCATLVNQQLSICNGKIYFNVRIRENDCLAITDVIYLIIIERKYENTPISYNIKIINNS